MRHLPRSVSLNAAGLLLAAAGIGIQIVGGVDYPVVPPGLLILIGTGVLVVVGRRRWTRVVGLIVPAFILVGGFVTGDIRRLVTDPGATGAFVGIIVQLVGLMVAMVAAAVSLVGGAASSRRSGGRPSDLRDRMGSR